MAMLLQVTPAQAYNENKPRLCVNPPTRAGVDIVVARHVVRQIFRTGERLGYQVVQIHHQDPHQTSTTNTPPSPTELWQATHRCGGMRGISTHVWVESGEYVLQFVVASMDGAGPFQDRTHTDVSNFDERVDQAVRAVLPPATMQLAPGQRFEPSIRAIPQPSLDTSTSKGTTPAGIHTEDTNTEEAPATPHTAESNHGLWVAIQSDSAVGLSLEDPFYNHLLGARLDYQLADELFLGAYLGYANVRSKTGRGANLLSYGQVENRIPVGRSGKALLPIRLGLGYLPFNGPFIRMGMGVQFKLDDASYLGFDLLTPTFWVLPDRTAFSLNVGVEYTRRLSRKTTHP